MGLPSGRAARSPTPPRSRAAEQALGAPRAASPRPPASTREGGPAAPPAAGRTSRRGPDRSAAGPSVPARPFDEAEMRRIDHPSCWLLVRLLPTRVPWPTPCRWGLHRERVDVESSRTRRSGSYYFALMLLVSAFEVLLLDDLFFRGVWRRGFLGSSGEQPDPDAQAQKDITRSSRPRRRRRGIARAAPAGLMHLFVARACSAFLALFASACCATTSPGTR